jgi:hypothetical protein
VGEVKPDMLADDIREKEREIAALEYAQSLCLDRAEALRRAWVFCRHGREGREREARLCLAAITYVTRHRNEAERMLRSLRALLERVTGSEIP